MQISGQIVRIADFTSTYLTFYFNGASLERFMIAHVIYARDFSRLNRVIREELE